MACRLVGTKPSFESIGVHFCLVHSTHFNENWIKIQFSYKKIEFEIVICKILIILRQMKKSDLQCWRWMKKSASCRSPTEAIPTRLVPRSAMVTHPGAHWTPTTRVAAAPVIPAPASLWRLLMKHYPRTARPVSHGITQQSEPWSFWIYVGNMTPEPPGFESWRCHGETSCPLFPIWTGIFYFVLAYGALEIKIISAISYNTRCGGEQASSYYFKQWWLPCNPRIHASPCLRG